MIGITGSEMKTYFATKTSRPNIVFQRNICETTEINIRWLRNISPVILEIAQVIDSIIWIIKDMIGNNHIFYYSNFATKFCSSHFRFSRIMSHIVPVSSHSLSSHNNSTINMAFNTKRNCLIRWFIIFLFW